MFGEQPHGRVEIDIRYAKPDLPVLQLRVEGRGDSKLPRHFLVGAVRRAIEVNVMLTGGGFDGWKRAGQILAGNAGEGIRV